jgi:acetyl esterase/lipase
MKNTFLLILSFFLFSKVLAQPEIIKLWPDTIPNSIVNANYKEVEMQAWGRMSWAGVSSPEIHIYKPSPSNNKHIAVILIPGGAYYRIAFEKEGIDVSKWLNEKGITAIILKYRLPNDSIMKDKSIGPLQDAQEAVRIVRRNATHIGVAPNKIGVMGFSAGGHLASTLCTRFNEKIYRLKDSVSARPDFAALIYPVISMKKELTHMGSMENLLGKNASDSLIAAFSNELHVKKNTPSTFLVHSADDGAVNYLNSIEYFKALNENKVKSELHIYPTGGHGYGMASQGKTEKNWTSTFLEWLNSIEK